MITLSLLWSIFHNWQLHRIAALEKEKYHSSLAGAISEFYTQRKVTVSYVDIKKTIATLEKVIPKYFDNHEYKVDDFLALAVIESDFNRYCIGKAGERGMFQILDWKTALVEIETPLANPFDIEVNIKMACYVLKQKHLQYKNYRDAIIAYNGYIINDKGEVVDKYWQKFIQAQKLIQELKGQAKEL
jgi:soluble lytic murein transglycosylase-like protein